MKFFYFAILFCFYSCVTKLSNTLPDLKLGQPELPQEIKTTVLAKGLKYYSINRGVASDKDVFTLSTGVLLEPELSKIKNKLQILGYQFWIDKVPETDPYGESLGVLLRLGNYKTVHQANVIKRTLKANGLEMSVKYTAEDGSRTTGPFKISLVEVDLNVFNGDIKSALAKSQIKTLGLTTELATQHEALMAINAGFFTWNSKVGIPGDPAGISVIDGQLVSDAINGRPALMINKAQKNKVEIIQNLKTELTLQIKDTVFSVQGVNRALGKVLNCGNKNRQYVEVPIHDFVCETEHDLVVYTPKLGDYAPKGKGLEVVIKNNKVISVLDSLGAKIPKKGYIVQASGVFITHLKRVLSQHTPILFNYKLLSDKGELTLTQGLYLVNGGPTLLRDGNMHLIDRATEGWETQFKNKAISNDFVDEKDAFSSSSTLLKNRNGFYYNWVVRRHPRTAVGVTKDNKMYIAVVYGRQPRVSAGATITEMALLLKALGAEHAINLDGGGSSMMVVNGQKTGRSSDASGERAVGDALLITQD